MDDTLTAEPRVSSDGKVVAFVASFRNQSVQCSITRDALERHFWLPAGANQARVLKAFADGHLRITAAVERRMLKKAGAPIVLSAADFADR
ncbi:DUF1488 family protein [Paraburkholderia sp. BL10I2N1]|uniref:DUF1488 family protein n=1 Tax=Paraburkholderia sp. BL10I2N1 TaxID=1938796 RepID=UPI00105D2C25|nr:DUF1488 family protein [Paraburkholderia sp. BL10I2N1]TDN66802.1 uncharacterized protein DUF1488 [Paraburkholderia sp. BL10I2N1]TDN68859.1 uncharacterized protein DUF1488 [Paraburkholderia sp. BL10I2N1]